MMRIALLACVAALAACAPHGGTPDQVSCERQANDDPRVKELIIKGAGSENFQRQTEDALAAARQDATVECLRGRGIVPRGGVERQKPL